MSVTSLLTRNKSRTDDGERAKIWIDAIPLFKPRRSDNRAFGLLRRTQIGTCRSTPIPLKWDVGATWLKLGDLTEVRPEATHVVLEGRIVAGSCSDVAIKAITKGSTPIWVLPQLECADAEEHDIHGMTVTTGWRITSVILTTRPMQQKMWEPDMTPISVQTDTGSAPIHR